jgi:peptidoglycan hydrolase-like protein with peptidoglycan-binding domain
MQALYDRAAWRPLSDVNPEPVIVPRLLIWHTMVGTLRGTEAYFRRQGYSGVESTFGLGGAADESLDGRLWQWQRLDREADAQYHGNPLATSIECSDGGDPDRPLSDLQLDTSIRLGVDWCRLTGIAPKVATAWNGQGFGYHRMFLEWNGSAHTCPGDVRAAQLESLVWPEIARLWDGQTEPKPPVTHEIPRFPLPSGWYFGPRSGPLQSVSGYHGHRADLQRWQQQMRWRGWLRMIADGLYGPVTARVTREFQAEKGLQVDGLIGPVTWSAAWKLKVT